MNSFAQFLQASEAAQRLGVSRKALRLYEERGLVVPRRTAAGWRVYGPDEMARAREVVALRRLGLGLGEVGRVLDGDVRSLDPALAVHEAGLEAELRRLGETLGRVRELRAELERGATLAAATLTEVLRPAGRAGVAFSLPWPWGGERFELTEIGAITYIIGPLGSGKTRLAMRLAEELPNAAFLGLDRQAGEPADAEHAARIERALAWLVDEGATASPALLALVAGLEAEGPDMLVIDMIEQGLDGPTQEAVIGYLRSRGAAARPLFVMTRSSSILDLAMVGPGESILLCPANHSPPMAVAPYPGAPGYEAVATCLATPEVRARSEGVVAMRV